MMNCFKEEITRIKNSFEIVEENDKKSCRQRPAIYFTPKNSGNLPLPSKITSNSKTHLPILLRRRFTFHKKTQGPHFLKITKILFYSFIISLRVAKQLHLIYQSMRSRKFNLVDRDLHYIHMCWVQISVIHLISIFNYRLFDKKLIK